MCGIAGHKPTYGLVSRRGIMPLSFSLDHGGPMCWTAEDCALMMDVLAGYDPLDPGSADVPKPSFALGGDIKGKLGSEPAVIALIADAGDSVPYVVAVNPAAQDLGLKANELVQQLGTAVGGRGGGKADLAQGSGKGAAGIDAGLAALRAELGRS